MYIGFVDEFLDSASEQVFSGFDQLINSFLKSREFIEFHRDFFQFSVIPFLIDQISSETNIEALYIKLNIFTEVFYGVYGDEDNSDENSDEESSDIQMDPEREYLAQSIYKMCFALMQNKDPQVFAFCSKLMRQLFQRAIYKLDNQSAWDLIEVLCKRIQNKPRSDEDCPEVLSVNMFGLIFYALAKDSDLVYKLLEIGILEKILNVLTEYDNGEPIDEVFGVLNLIVEIIYKFAKTDSLDRMITLDHSLLSELLSHFLSLKDIFNFGVIYVGEVINIIYYISSIVCISKTYSKLNTSSPIDLKEFDWDLLYLLDQKLEKDVVKTRKKINKLRKLIK
jgi:hypothetical protein